MNANAAATDSLDRKARAALDREYERLSAQGMAFELSGAGLPAANGRYVPDKSGDYARIGYAFVKGDFTLLFEKKGRKLASATTVIPKDRWLLFNDADGVHGSRPYYQVCASHNPACIK